MISAAKQSDFRALMSASILDNCPDVAFTEARDGVQFLNYIDMEASGDDATVHVRFDFKCHYAESVSRDGLRTESIPSELASVEVVSVRVIVDDFDVAELYFEPTQGSEIYKEWCEAVLKVAQSHESLILEKFGC